MSRVTGEWLPGTGSAWGWWTHSKEQSSFTYETIGGLEGRSLGEGRTEFEGSPSSPRSLGQPQKFRASTFRVKQLGAAFPCDKLVELVNQRDGKV